MCDLKEKAGGVTGSDLLQALSRDHVAPVLHVFSGEFVLDEHADRLAVFTSTNGFDHLLKVHLVALVLSHKQI